MSLTYTAGELEALRKARVSGATEVTFESGGTRRIVRYRSLEEIDAILADADASVNAATATTKVRRVHVNMEDGF